MPVLHHTTSPEDKVSWNQLIAFGTGGLIPIALFNIAGQLMVLIGNIGLGLSAFWLGTIMIIPRLWDAISDPIIGHISDNARTSWGRRRPFILFGAIAVAISFVAMWWVPKGDAIIALFPSENAYNWFQVVFILISLLVFFTSCTIFEIPHGALGMEISSDYHERTRLFSSKSFMGNLFAMVTPWLLFLAGLDFFKGVGGNLADGMRVVSILIAVLLIPMAIWWFYSLQEPRLRSIRIQKRTAFWKDMQITISNRTFVCLVVIIFTLAMGFNFVSLFNYYIVIFYLYGGDQVAAGKLLGINGTVWAITGLIAVFPLNWTSRRLGKNKTLFIAIVLMCIAQLSKIVCYNLQYPYLVLIPTVLLSSGMLMFFTLGSSMVGDVCDEDELHTGKRSEGSYYAVYWWFIKMGTAFASFITGALLVSTSFDENQVSAVNEIHSHMSVIQAEVKAWAEESGSINAEVRKRQLAQSVAVTLEDVENLNRHFQERIQAHSKDAAHINALALQLGGIESTIVELRSGINEYNLDPESLLRKTDQTLDQIALLTQQTPHTLLMLRIIEISLPVLLSVVSLTLITRYPLNEDRCYEIKELLSRKC